MALLFKTLPISTSYQTILHQHCTIYHGLKYFDQLILCSKNIINAISFIYHLKVNDYTVIGEQLWHLYRKYHAGSSCSKLTTSLVNVSLNFQKLISQICQYFLLKKCEKLLQCKSFSHFFNKKFQCIWL